MNELEFKSLQDIYCQAVNNGTIPISFNYLREQNSKINHELRSDKRFHSFKFNNHIMSIYVLPISLIYD